MKTLDRDTENVAENGFVKRRGPHLLLGWVQQVDLAEPDVPRSRFESSIVLIYYNYIYGTRKGGWIKLHHALDAVQQLFDVVH